MHRALPGPHPRGLCGRPGPAKSPLCRVLPRRRRRRPRTPWRRVVATAVTLGVATPVFASSLAYRLARRERGPASLLQAQRDFFKTHLPADRPAGRLPTPAGPRTARRWGGGAVPWRPGWCWSSWSPPATGADRGASRRQSRRAGQANGRAGPRPPGRRCPAGDASCAALPPLGAARPAAAGRLPRHHGRAGPASAAGRPGGGAGCCCSGPTSSRPPGPGAGQGPEGRAGIPLEVAVDQERAPGWPAWPGSSAPRRRPPAARPHARRTGPALRPRHRPRPGRPRGHRRPGPVLDVTGARWDGFIGDRSFGADPATAGRARWPSCAA